MISIKNLHFSYPSASKPCLNNLNLDIPAQSLFGLLGPNGAGKSTLLSILSRLTCCAPGLVFIDGHDIAASSKPPTKLSLVPQEHAFYNTLSVIENLRFFGRAQGLSSSNLSSRIAQVTYITGLEDRLQARGGTLSGGLKRRLNLAIGLLNEPTLLLLDEPTVGIDPHSRHFILETIKDLNRQGTTVLYTSHYLEEVEALCDQIAIIDNGQVLLQGSLQQLLQADNSPSLLVDLKDSLSAEQVACLNITVPFKHDQQRLEIQISDDSDIVALLESLSQQHIGIARLQYGARNLEELFLNQTQRSLRD